MRNVILLIIICSCCQFCKTKIKREVLSQDKRAAYILGNPEYLAISYGGYRADSRDIQPSISEIKEDMKILSAMGIRILRTYNVQLPHASNVLAAIQELQKEDPTFEMYVMLGAWIDCKNAWQPGKENHEEESEQNEKEIDRAIALAQKYPTIVKVIAVGNEAMVHWAASYFVRPRVILKWVDHLQQLKKSEDLPSDLWITSSDNYASWGGGTDIYHVADLEALIKAVDFISLHTYPMHETHYISDFWIQRKGEQNMSDIEKIDGAMHRARQVAKDQYNAVTSYIRELGVDKPIHIGETGWASVSDEFYGPEGSRACDEYKQGSFYNHMREWTNQDSISCFFFEAFDERWKDAEHINGSENHFGLITLNGEAKFAIWDLVDQGVFEKLGRNGKPITKTYSGDKQALLETVLVPPTAYTTD